MRIVVFTHSLRSCWNHGNAHFLRGVTRDLIRRGHDVVVYEPHDGWSARNLVADHGESALDAYREGYPELRARCVDAEFDTQGACDGADLVIVHEWNEPALVAAVGRARRTQRFTLLFHDTHHRAVSDPSSLAAYDLDNYDGVLTFGETLAERYRQLGWGQQVFVWHEAADVTVFHPPLVESSRIGIVWIGNWGDGERTAELEEYLFAPTYRAGLSLDVHGVRYPPDARALLVRYGARYHGWLANTAVPATFASHLATVHVPRRLYATHLPGIPTIRVFEALACGIPLVSAPWRDSEHLFRPGVDFLVAEDGTMMQRHLEALRDDPGLRKALADHGQATILARHTCSHRVDELLSIVDRLRAPTHSRENV